MVHNIEIRSFPQSQRVKRCMVTQLKHVVKELSPKRCLEINNLAFQPKIDYFVVARAFLGLRRCQNRPIP